MEKTAGSKIQRYRVKQSRDTGSNNPEIQGQTIQRYRVKLSRNTGRHQKQDEDEQNKNNIENYKY